MLPRLFLVALLPLVATRAAPDTAEVAARATLAHFASVRLEASQLAITCIELDGPNPSWSSFRGGEMIYPASVIKLFYLAAAHRWLEDGRLPDSPELQRAFRDMIVDSSNDATHYVIDVLTGTTSGPELPETDLQAWFEKRNVVTRYFASLGYRDVIACKKPWGDGPYGRESQAIARFEPKRNMLTTDATARLLLEIVQRRCVSRERSEAMLGLMSRDLQPSDPDPDHQARFTGPALPPGSRLWSKAGWTSQTRHDACYLELPDGRRRILVVFTTNHAQEREIIPFVARQVLLTGPVDR